MATSAHQSLQQHLLLHYHTYASRNPPVRALPVARRSMAPKAVIKKAKAKAKDKAAAKPKSKAAASPPGGVGGGDGSSGGINAQIADSVIQEHGVNSIVLDTVLDARQTVLDQPLFSDVAGLKPGNINDGTSHMAAYDEEQANGALKDFGTYLAGANLFWIDIMNNINSGVPISMNSINQLVDRFFAAPPAAFPGTVTVGVITGESVNAASGKLVRISPEEMLYAYFIGAAKSIEANQGDDNLVSNWKKVALSVPMSFVRCTNQDDRYWKAVNLREEIGTQYATMYRSAVQRIFELVNWKKRIEKRDGVSNMSVTDVTTAWETNVTASSMGETVNYGFIDAALTVWNRMLSDPTCQQIVLTSEEEWGKRTPWDSVYKLELVIKRCGKDGGETSLVNMRWVLASVSDMIKNEYAVPAFFTLRNLNGRGQPGNKGIQDVILYKMGLKMGCTKFMIELNTFKSDELDRANEYLRSHEAYRSFFGHEGEVVSRAFLNRHPKCMKDIILFFGDPVVFKISSAPSSSSNCCPTPPPPPHPLTPLSSHLSPSPPLALLLLLLLLLLPPFPSAQRAPEYCGALG